MAVNENVVISKDVGPVSAYAVAVAEGFEGTKEEWESYIANASINAQRAHENALKSEGYSSGTQDGVPVTDPDSPYHENNAEYFKSQAALSAQAAEGSKNAVQNMTVSSQELTPGSTPTVQKNVDPQTGAVTLQYGLSAGVTYTPSVTNGVLSFTNDGNKQNPSPVDIPALVESVFVVTVSGTTPTITGADNHRYVCGEVTTITIVPPSSGTIEVIFESGSTATILTASGVVWPDWFDASALEEDRIYDMIITDGVYGAVMSWSA